MLDSNFSKQQLNNINNIQNENQFNQSNQILNISRNPVSKLFLIELLIYKYFYRIYQMDCLI